VLYQAKAGTPVFVPLPPHVADLLRSIPPGLKPNPNHFFWSGNGLPKTFVAKLAARLSPPFQGCRSPKAGRYAKTLPLSHVPRYVRGRNAAGGPAHVRGT
jgi:hypothetical protein